MSPDPVVSVIIPTYNRRDSLLRTLESLGRGTYPIDAYEVIVVDDGSTDGTGHLNWSVFPFCVRYYWQENAGATKARNTGACISSAEFLVFMDDDIVATPGMLECLVQEVSTFEQVIVLATLIPRLDNTANPFTELYCSGAIFPGDLNNLKPTAYRGARSELAGCFVHFTRCTTGVLGIRRQDFHVLDMFQDPTGGWPNWDDVDFGSRAHLRGFRLWRSYRAIAYHHDYSLRSLASSCKRQERASRSAARFFKRYAALAQEFPQFQDKGPISFLTDPPVLLIRKILRSIVSCPPSVAALEHLTHALERNRPKPLFFLVLLYRWIISAYMHRGYRQGLRELAAAEE
jgi:glycosyltransferase involved in cell wall biosynthesis